MAALTTPVRRARRRPTSTSSRRDRSRASARARRTFEEKEFTTAPNDRDKSFTVTITGANETDDFALSVDRVEKDGSRTQLDQDGGSPPATSETVTISDPVPAKYVIHVDNYASQDPAW